jgi:hypothetical protein
MAHGATHREMTPATVILSASEESPLDPTQPTLFLAGTLPALAVPCAARDTVSLVAKRSEAKNDKLLTDLRGDVLGYHRPTTLASGTTGIFSSVSSNRADRFSETCQVSSGPFTSELDAFPFVLHNELARL